MSELYLCKITCANVKNKTKEDNSIKPTTQKDFDRACSTEMSPGLGATNT